ncbi:Mannosyltransferase OCH1 and related enzymes [hydrothermal vent metagenome]|uniref:Mannosyltransferase OCH1 and related enzymes n=1 Tax=hydrothermal vent metagenome TaxID=652676 RepID=A0A3B0WXB9_9ZZZZ
MNSQYKNNSTPKKFKMFIISRIIKIIANLLKAFSYLFHFIFPNKRFTIPKHAPPLLKSNKKSIINKIVWQTNFTNTVTLPIYLNYLFNRLMSYDYGYRFMTNEDRSEFIKSEYPDSIFNAYEKIQIGAAMADLWRVLVLNKFGGVYMDIDAHLIRTLNSIIDCNTSELYIVIKKNEISNYFIASMNDNPNLKKIIKQIVTNIDENKLDNVYTLTGPGVFNKTLDINCVNTIYYRYTCNQGNFTNEYFQYIDKPQGKWTKEQEKIDIIKKDTSLN